MAAINLATKDLTLKPVFDSAQTIFFGVLSTAEAPFQFCGSSVVLTLPS